MQPIRRSRLIMEGTFEFYPYSYLLDAASNALDAAKFHEKHREPGRNFHYITAVTFSAFAVEAVVNHIGQDKVPNWNEGESWRKKITKVAALAKVNLDYTTDPFKTVEEAFEFRNKLAHGKTWIGDVTYFMGGDEPDSYDHSFPDWLFLYMNEAEATRTYCGARQAVQSLLAGAGYSANEIHKSGEGSSHSIAGPMRPPVWKIKT